LDYVPIGELDLPTNERYEAVVMYIVMILLQGFEGQYYGEVD